jgi:U3 small nucleolar RNA-associated protein 15
VHISRFSSDPSQILTASDDTTLRLWDLPTETSLSVYSGHGDYVRSALVSPDNASLVLSGSYDGTVRLWDTRLDTREANVMTMRHGAPVEDALIYPTGGGGIAVSAGGPTLRVWDLMMGGRCLRATSNHAKTITSLAISTSDAEGSGGHALRLLSAGLDGLVKVYDPARDYVVTHTMRYPSPLLSIALSADEQHIATGGADGTLCIRTRALRANEAAARAEATKAKEQGTQQLFMAAASADSGGAAATLQEAATVRTKRLSPFDSALKSFRYADALDAALRAGTNKHATFALLTELSRRSSADGKEDGLRRAVAGRDEGALEPLLRFLLRHAGNPEHNAVVCKVADVVIGESPPPPPSSPVSLLWLTFCCPDATDTYASILGQSPLIDDLFGRLWAKVTDEVRLHREVEKVRGALEMLVVRGTGV